MIYADIIIDISSDKLDRSFQYRVPERLEKKIKAGMVAAIPFGNTGRVRKGYVIGLSDKPKIAPEKIKEISEICSGEETTESRLIALAAWMRENYGSTMPCSGYGVIGKKPEIKYRVTAQKQEEIVILQRTILDNAAEYVKPGGVLVFSTCTIAKEENEENMLWFLNNHPFKLESIDPYLPEELHSETTALGYLQLLPGVHKTDGFFIAKFRRK